MAERKLPFSIDALMANEGKTRSDPSSDQDSSISEANLYLRSDNGRSPQPFVDPIPWYPSYRYQNFQRYLQPTPGFHSRYIGLNLQNQLFPYFPWYNLLSPLQLLQHRFGLGMTKPKLSFSIDALMGNEDNNTRYDTSSDQDSSVPRSQNGSPQMVVPIPTFPSSGTSSSLERQRLLQTQIFQRSLPPAPGFDPRIAGMLLQGEAYPTFPWYLHPRSRFLQHRYGPGPDLPGFLLPPFRKAKRIRTAFSASQLMKLEGAFDRNHYVTGNERKQLADSLGLTETQVKVWFQNRRTKAKRQVIEDRERGEKNQSFTSSKEMESQQHSSLSDPNLSPPEQRDDSLCDDEGSDDMFPTEGQNELNDE